MDSKEQLGLTILIYIMLVIMMITAISLWKLKNKVEEIESRQLKINEYILNRIGG